MALIRTSGILGGISGALGGIVFVQTKNATVARHRPAPRTATSPRLQSARARFHNGHLKWVALSDDDQTAWRNAAALYPTTNRLGLASPSSGFQFFMKMWTENFLKSGDNPVPIPTLGTAAPAQNISLDFSVSGSYDVDADEPPTGAPAKIGISGYPFMKNWPTRDVPKLVHFQFAGILTLPANIKTAWETEFGAMVTGQHFAVGITTQSAGLINTERNIVRGIVTA